MQISATIDFDLPCITCGYNLRTRPADAVCPECSTSISITTVQSPYNWPVERLQRIVRGIMLIATGMMIPIVTLGFIVLIAFLPKDSGDSMQGLFIMLLFSCVLGTILHLAGMRILTLPSTGDPIERFDGALRLSISIAAVAMGALALGVCIVYGGTRLESLAIFLVFDFSLLLALLAFYFVLLALRLPRLSARCDWPALSSALRWTFISLAAGFGSNALAVLLLGLLIACSLESSLFVTPVVSLLSILTGVGSLLLLAGAIPANIALFRLRALMLRVPGRLAVAEPCHEWPQ